MSPEDAIPPQPPPESMSAPLLVRRMGHDFNNLFSIILGGLSLLREEIPASAWGADLDEVYDDVVSATREAADVIAQLTAWAGRQALNPRPTDLEQLARDMAPMLERALPGSITVSLEAPGPAPVASVDPARLQQALMELAANARDAMPDGGTLVIALGTNGGGAPSLTVADDGVGMSAEVLARCTEPYFTTRPDAQHRGTGLSVVDGFARASGGQLRITSAPGTGTRVSLTLPPGSENQEPTVFHDPA